MCSASSPKISRHPSIRTTLHRCVRILAAHLVLGGVLAPGAQADSDGYYCVGRGYLAYELRGGLSTEGSSHILRVVRFGEGGIVLAGEVPLEDFQPHSMVCRDEQVRIGGFSSRPVEYVIDISAGTGPRVAHVVTNPQLAAQRTPLKNLGAWAPNGTVALPSDDQSHIFRLVTVESEERVGDEILHHKRTEIVMTDREGNVSQRLELFNGHRVETID